MRRQYEVVPVSLDDGVLTVVTPEPLTDDERSHVEETANVRVAFREAERTQITAANTWLDTFSAAATEQDDESAAAKRRQSEANYKSLVGGDDMVARSVRSLIADAVARNASDIHISTELVDGYEQVSANLRVLGDLVRHDTYDPGVGDALLHRFRRAGIKESTTVGALDGQYDITLPSDGKSSGGRYDLRMVYMPLRYGAMLVVRLLPQERSQHSDLASVFPPRDSDVAERIRRSVSYGSGLVIVAGRTGDGKSTTLASILDYVAVPERKVVSIEDPVETLIPGVQQVPFHAKHLTFAQGLKAFLRADPDIIMVGEIRDRETAEVAIMASQTGHTLLSTVHARNSSRAPTRLTNMGVDPGQIAEEMRLIVSQRLVKRLCRTCSGDGEARGCGACTGGYAGRAALAETLEVNDDMMTAIEKGLSARVLEQLEGYRRFEEHAAALIANKITTAAEVKRALGVDIPPEMIEQGAEAAGGTQR